jgi:hypothetical protein
MTVPILPGFTTEQWETTMYGFIALREFEIFDEQLAAYEACNAIISAAPKLYALLREARAALGTNAASELLERIDAGLADACGG